MKITHILNVLREEFSEYEVSLHQVLAYVYERRAQRVQTRIADLVQKINFGTGPTVYNKLQWLEVRGLIELKQCPTDGRAKVIVITPAGIGQLREMEKVLLGAV